MTRVGDRLAVLKNTRLQAIAGVLLVLGVLGGVFVNDHFFRTRTPFFSSDEDHFLFGSIGTEATAGIPYWIWLVLPRIFPEYLPAPGGYASLGVLARDGHEMPVGFSKVTIGFERVGTNCAICHTASFRLQPDDPPTIVPAAPAHQVAPQQYQRFLFACASDPRFTADTILAEIDKNYRLPISDRLIYRFIVIPSTARAILRLRDQDSWMNDRTEWGRGRVDLFNPVKFGPLGQPIDTTIGNSDMQPIWNLNAHAGSPYQWDGSNTNLQEVVIASAISAGASPRWIDRDYEKWNATDARAISSLRRVQNYLGTVQPPKFPLPIDGQLAAAGATVFQGTCATCHASAGARTGTLIPIKEVATDPHRLATWTSASATTYNAYGSGHSWKFSRFRSTAGYAAVPLDGLWLRAPYLHNGSVPSLEDLLKSPESRPSFFWRGYDVYDPEVVGFTTSGDDARQVGTPFDTALPGNSNAGHTYGTSLAPGEKRALIEYLKTL
jgi:mono/diheme cytochrome c family protein